MLERKNVMLRLLNIGGIWRHPRTHQLIKPGESFLVDEVVVDRMQARGHIGTRFQIVDMDAPLGAAVSAQAGISASDDGDTEADGDGAGEDEDELDEDEEDEEEEDEEAEDEEWTLSMSPERYVRIYPDGKHADLARRLLGDS
jgi:hypothetical protein